MCFCKWIYKISLKKICNSFEYEYIGFTLTNQYMTFQETLEYLDNNNGEKSQYMELIQQVLFANGTSKEDTDVIVNAIYSYDNSK